MACNKVTSAYKRDITAAIALINFLVPLLCFVPTHFVIAAQKTYIKVVYSLPLTYDPIGMNDTASLAAVNLIHEGLLRFDSNLNVIPSIAESWDLSDDAKTLTFHLNKNAKFHDGSQVTSDDVIFSLSRAKAPGSKVASLYDSIVEIKKISNSTVEIKLKHAYPPILSILAGATAKILPHKLAINKLFFEHPVGAGAFKFKILNKKSKELLLLSNKNFVSGAPKIDEIILRELTEAQGVEMAIKNKVHDLSSWPLAAKSKAFTVGQKFTTPTAATWIIGLNTLKPPFDKLQVRQLFKKSIDSEAFRKKIFPDGLPAYGYVPYGLLGSKDFPQRPMEISKEVKPSKEKIVIVIPEILQEAQTIKSQLENDLKEDGWNVEVKLEAWDKMMEGYSKKTYQAFLVSMNMDYPDADFLLKNFESTNPDNFSGLKNLEIDKFVADSRATSDRKKREALYLVALDMVETESVTVNLFHPRSNYWISNCVIGFRPNILSEVYIDYSQVDLKENCEIKN